VGFYLDGQMITADDTKLMCELRTYELNARNISRLGTDIKAWSQDK
jgi:hypothetical protein